MKFILVVLFIRMIGAFFQKDEVVEISVSDIVDEGDGLHPAEFEVRDHFMIRCAE